MTSESAGPLGDDTDSALEEESSSVPALDLATRDLLVEEMIKAVVAGGCFPEQVLLSSTRGEQFLRTSFLRMRAVVEALFRASGVVCDGRAEKVPGDLGGEEVPFLSSAGRGTRAASGVIGTERTGVTTAPSAARSSDDHLSTSPHHDRSLVGSVHEGAAFEQQQPGRLDQQETLYWEPQVRGECARHAANMIAGYELFSSDDFQTAALHLQREARNILGPGEAEQHHQWIGNANGNWGREVLELVLRNEGVALEQLMLQTLADAQAFLDGGPLDEDTPNGFFVNAGEHWWAVVRVVEEGGNWYALDSRLPRDHGGVRRIDSSLSAYWAALNAQYGRRPVHFFQARNLVRGLGEGVLLPSQHPPPVNSAYSENFHFFQARNQLFPLVDVFILNSFVRGLGEGVLPAAQEHPPVNREESEGLLRDFNRSLTLAVENAILNQQNVRQRVALSNTSGGDGLEDGRPVAAVIFTLLAAEASVGAARVVEQANSSSQNDFVLGWLSRALRAVLRDAFCLVLTGEGHVDMPSLLREARRGALLAALPEEERYREELSGAPPPGGVGDLVWDEVRPSTNEFLRQIIRHFETRRGHQRSLEGHHPDRSLEEHHQRHQTGQERALEGHHEPPAAALLENAEELVVQHINAARFSSSWYSSHVFS